MMALQWGSVHCSPGCFCRPWPVNRTVQGSNQESVDASLLPPPSAAVCRTHAQASAELKAARAVAVRQGVRSGSPVMGTKHAHNLPDPLLAAGEFPIAASSTGRGTSRCKVLALLLLDSQKPGTGRDSGEGQVVWSGAGFLHQRRIPAERWSAWQRLWLQSSSSLCSTAEAKQRRNIGLCEAWHTLALCRGKRQQSLGHVCQQAPTGDS